MEEMRSACNVLQRLEVNVNVLGIELNNCDEPRTLADAQITITSIHFVERSILRCLLEPLIFMCVYVCV